MSDLNLKKTYRNEIVDGKVVERQITEFANNNNFPNTKIKVMNNDLIKPIIYTTTPKFMNTPEFESI